MTAKLEQQLLRIQTILDATSYMFPAEDANGFPNALPPARKIGLGRRSLTGLMTSGKKVTGPGPFESGLERDYYVLLEFDPTVFVWHPQPLKVIVPGRDGERNSTYVPDVLVERTTHIDGVYGQIATLVEVKYRADLKADWSRLKPRLKACRKFARARGWMFKVMTEVEIRTPRLINAKFLLPYRERPVEWDEEYRVAEALRRQGLATPRTLLEAMSNSPWERAAILPIIWFMVAKRSIEADLDQEITMNSPIRLFEHR